MLQVVAQHLFQEGRFAVGEAFLREAKVPYGEKLKAPFAAMHSVLQSVRLRQCPCYSRYDRGLHCGSADGCDVLITLICGTSTQPLAEARAYVRTLRAHAQFFAPSCLKCGHVQIQARDLKPALAWVEEHRLELFEASPFSAEDFEFRLHRLQFVQLLTTKGELVQPWRWLALVCQGEGLSKDT